jgi:hypothetical protein
MIARITNFAVVMVVVYFCVPVALPGTDVTLTQSASITLLAFVWRTLLSPEAPEVYLINAKEDDK